MAARWPSSRQRRSTGSRTAALPWRSSACIFGKPPAKGHRPPRAVWLYNFWHNYTLPGVLWIALLLLFAGNPWPLLGWMLHISLDRLMGFGLRGDDGGQALI